MKLEFGLWNKNLFVKNSLKINYFDQVLNLTERKNYYSIN